MVKLLSPLSSNYMTIKPDNSYRSLKRPNHSGVDIGGSAANGQPIYSSAPGNVIFSGYNNGYGNVIIIEHRDGTSTLYAHMEDESPYRVGDYVNEKEIIGKVGNTGKSNGPHLHFEHIDEEGTKIIKTNNNGKNIGLRSGINRLDPNNDLILGKDQGYFMWICEDENSCDDCLSRNGKIYRYGEDEEPPLHPNCNCSIEHIGIIKDYDVDMEYLIASKNFENSLFSLKSYLYNFRKQF